MKKQVIDESVTPDVDIKLFEQMKGAYISEEEKIFFETLHHKEDEEYAPSAELILSEDDNEDGIFIIRNGCAEYKVAHLLMEDGVERSGYFDSLADALACNLKEISLSKDSITLLEWLRKRNYAGIRYDRNFALD